MRKNTYEFKLERVNVTRQDQIIKADNVESAIDDIDHLIEDGWQIADVSENGKHLERDKWQKKP